MYSLVRGPADKYVVSRWLAEDLGHIPERCILLFFENKEDAEAYTKKYEMPPEMAMCSSIEDFLRVGSKLATAFDLNGWCYSSQKSKLTVDRYQNTIMNFSLQRSNGIEEQDYEFRVIYREPKFKQGKSKVYFRVKWGNKYVDGSIFNYENECKADSYSLSGYNVEYGDGQRIGNPQHYITKDTVDLGNIASHEDADTFVIVMVAAIIDKESLWKTNP